jgi:hypothetical protein
VLADYVALRQHRLTDYIRGRGSAVIGQREDRPYLLAATATAAGRSGAARTHRPVQHAERRLGLYRVGGSLRTSILLP